MSKVQARKLVLVSAFLLAVIAVYRDKQAGDVGNGTFRALWGVGVVSFALSLVADFAPGIAGPFAGLVVLGSLTHGGDQVIQKALGKVAVNPTGAPVSTPGGVTASGAQNASRPAAPAGKTPVGGPR